VWGRGAERRRMWVKREKEEVGGGMERGAGSKSGKGGGGTGSGGVGVGGVREEEGKRD